MIIMLMTWYGFAVDWEAPSPSDDGLSTVDVLNAECSFDCEKVQLLQNINPCQESSSFGVDIYSNAANLLDIL